MALKMVWLDTNNERMALNPTEQPTNLQKLLDDIKISEGYFLHLFESMP